MQRYDDFCYYANIYVVLCAHTPLLLTHIKNKNKKNKLYMIFSDEKDLTLQHDI